MSNALHNNSYGRSILALTEEYSTFYSNIDTLTTKGDYPPFVQKICALTKKNFRTVLACAGEGAV